MRRGVKNEVYSTNMYAENISASCKTSEIEVNIQVCCLFLFFAALFYRRVKMVVKGDHPLSLLMC